MVISLKITKYYTLRTLFFPIFMISKSDVVKSFLRGFYFSVDLLLAYII